MNDLIDLLNHYELLSQTDVLLAKKYCENWQCSHFEGLLETHIITDSALADILAQIMQLERLYKIVDGDNGTLAREKIHFSEALSLQILPINFEENSKKMNVVVCDPTASKKFELLKEKINCEFVFSVATSQDILAASYSLYSISDELSF